MHVTDGIVPNAQGRYITFTSPVYAPIIEYYTQGLTVFLKKNYWGVSAQSAQVSPTPSRPPGVGQARKNCDFHR